MIMAVFISTVANTEVLTNGLEIPMGAAVGLLTRNIKVVGEDYGDLYVESFGARVLIGLTAYNNQTSGGMCFVCKKKSFFRVL